MGQKNSNPAECRHLFPGRTQAARLAPGLLLALLLSACGAGENPREKTPQTADSATTAHTPKDDNKPAFEVAGLSDTSDFGPVPELGPAPVQQYPLVVATDELLSPSGKLKGKHITATQYCRLDNKVIETILPYEVERMDKEVEIHVLHWGRLKDGRFFLLLAERELETERDEEVLLTLMCYDAAGEWLNTSYLAQYVTEGCQKETASLQLSSTGEITLEEKQLVADCPAGAAAPPAGTPYQLTQHTRARIRFPSTVHHGNLKPEGPVETLQ